MEGGGGGCFEIQTWLGKNGQTTWRSRKERTGSAVRPVRELWRLADSCQIVDTHLTWFWRGGAARKQLPIWPPLLLWDGGPHLEVNQTPGSEYN